MSTSQKLPFYSEVKQLSKWCDKKKEEQIIDLPPDEVKKNRQGRFKLGRESNKKKRPTF